MMRHGRRLSEEPASEKRKTKVVERGIGKEGKKRVQMLTTEYRGTAKNDGLNKTSGLLAAKERWGGPPKKEQERRVKTQTNAY